MVVVVVLVEVEVKEIVVVLVIVGCQSLKVHQEAPLAGAVAVTTNSNLSPKLTTNNLVTTQEVPQIYLIVRRLRKKSGSRV